MPENPETLNSKFDKAGAGDGSLASLNKQIDMHQQAADNKSVLDKLVHFVYDKDAQSLEQLKQLKAQAEAQAVVALVGTRWPGRGLGFQCLAHGIGLGGVACRRVKDDKDFLVSGHVALCLDYIKC